MYKRRDLLLDSSQLTTTMPFGRSPKYQAMLDAATDEEKQRIAAAIAEKKIAAENLRRRKEEKKQQDDWNCKATDQALLDAAKKNK